MLDQIPLQLDRKGIKESEDGERGGEGGDYLREVIILNIAIKGGQLYIRGRQLHEGRLLFNKVQYFKLNTVLPFVPYAN